VDEYAYRITQDEVNRLPCVFGKALLAQCAVCELARRHAIGERETVACSSPVARSACGTLYGLLREKSAFALHLKETQHILPHALVMKIQCGGLEGLKQVVAPEAHAPDVHKLVRAAVAACGSLDALPFSDIVKGVAAWQGRKRRK
jgi:hypothetical protein